jgi:hypothetical protein
MTLLDAILLIGSAAIGMGGFMLAYRTWFEGWIWVLNRGLPDPRTWRAMDVIVACSDTVVFLIPLVAPWTLLLIMLRLRAPRPSWRRIWRQPGMAACVAAVVGWCWSGLGLLFAFNAVRLASAQRAIKPEEWVQKYFSDEVFMYVGLAVASVWIVQILGGQWRPSTDWIDQMGRLVGVLWIVIGLVWTMREYLEFV